MEGKDLLLVRKGDPGTWDDEGGEQCMCSLAFFALEPLDREG